MKKKLLSLLLVLVLVISVTVIMAAAEETAPSVHEHCVCGGKGNGRGDHVCADSGKITWTPFTLDLCETMSDGRLSIPSGSYYLAEDLKTDKAFVIMPNTEVSICLNGKTLESSSRVFRVHGTLNIAECTDGTGKVIGTNGGQAPVFYIAAQGHINHYRGILRAPQDSKNYGGVGAIGSDVSAGIIDTKASGSMTMYGGTLDASKVTLVKNSSDKQGYGGALIIFGEAGTPCSFIQYGGTIYAAKSVEDAGAAIYASATSTVKLLGGNIGKGSAKNVGDGVYAYKGCDLTIGGAVKIDDLYVVNGQTFTTQNLTGSVGLSTPVTNSAALTTCTQNEAANFTSNVTGRSVIATESEGSYQIALGGHNAHCECGGNLDNQAALAAHGECVASENWIALDQETLDSMLVASCPEDTALQDEDGKGNANMLRFGDEYDDACYYLTENVTVSKAVEIHQNDNITICLNGYTWKSTITGNSALRVWGTLNITDCTESGQITSSASNKSNAPVLYMFGQHADAQKGVVVNLYGGTLKAQDTDSSAAAGVVNVNNASDVAVCTLNIYGGTITGGYGLNGSVNLNGKKGTPQGAICNMYGGTITNGVSTSYSGGNLRVTNGQFYMYGGTLSGGIGKDGLSADVEISYNTNNVCVIDGKVSIGTMVAYGAASPYRFELGDNFATDSIINLNASNSAGAIIKSATYDQLANFAALQEDTYQVTCEGSIIYLRDAAAEYHCRCGGAPTHEGLVHNCSDVEWTELTAELLATFTTTTNDGSSYVIPAGNYILNADLTVDKCLRIESGTTVNLDLNGHTLTDTGSAGTKLLRVVGNLNISDSSYNAQAETEEARFQGQIIATKEESGSLVYISEKTGKMIVYGGNLKTAYSESATPIYAAVASSGELYISGGTVTGANLASSNSGGTITVFDDGELRVYGGVISGGTAVRGGNICAPSASSIVRVYGGEITDGAALGAASGANGGGGNIYSSGTVSIMGGIITGGTASRTQSSAQAYGGNIYLNSDTKTLRISNGTISDGTAVTGGNIFCRGAFTMEDGTIIGGTATGGMGGNLRLVATATVNMTGGTVSNGHSSSQGGNLSLAENTRENVISNVKFIGGICDSNSGGSVYISGCTNVTIDNIEIDGGTSAKGSGGALYIAGAESTDGTLTQFVITNSTIKGGSALNYGGNIYGNANAHITLTNCTVSGGGATYGGNIHAAGKLTLTGAQGVISDGEATYEGGNIHAAGLYMYDGTVSGGIGGSYGGSIYLKGDSEIWGGKIENGLSTSTSRNGGNISVSNKSTLTVYGGEICGGKANEGGNMSVRDGSTLNIEGGAIYGGEALGHGGNIAAYTTLNISSGDIYGGKATLRGGNISTYGNYGKITITGGHIYDGILTGKDNDAEPDGIIDQVAADLYGANISMLSITDRPLELTILGGEIGGFGEGCVEGVSSVHIQSTGDEITTTVGGDAVIDSLRLGTDRMLTIHEDGFSEGASIGIERFEITGLFAPGAAADYAQYFHGSTEGTEVSADETGLIVTSSIPYWAFNAAHNPIGSANTIAEAMALEGATFVRLVADHTTDEVVNGDVYLDLYGYDLTGLTVTGTANIIDYKTINYEDGVAGNLINFSGNVQKFYTSDGVSFNGVRTYVALQAEDGSYSFHRMSVSISHVSLKPGADALGYKATVMGDSELLAAITGFGFNMGIEGGDMRTYTKTGSPVNGEFTLRLQGIMAANGGEMTIIGQPVIYFGEESFVGGENKTSMKDTIEAIEAAVAENAKAYTEAQMTAVQEFIATYESNMSGWDIDSIKAWTVPSTEEETPAA